MLKDEIKKQLQRVLALAYATGRHDGENKILDDWSKALPVNLHPKGSITNTAPIFRILEIEDKVLNKLIDEIE